MRSESFQAYWPLSLAVIVLAVGGALLLERGAASNYVASGSVMIAGPEVDPTRSAARAVDLTLAIAETSTTEAREGFAADGGRDDYRIIQVSDNRLQVFANGEGAVQGVRAVLRSLSNVVAGQQLAAEIDADERIQPRLFIQIPEGELDALAAVEGRVTGELPEVIGTLVLEDPLAGAANPLDSVALATSLVLLTITSDAGSQAVADTLPDGVGFTVSGRSRQAPGLLAITTTGPDPADVLRAFDAVTSAVDAELQRRQELAESPREDRLLVDVIASPLEAREADPGRSTGALALLALGFGVAVLLPSMLQETVGDRAGWPWRRARVDKGLFAQHQEPRLCDAIDQGRTVKTR